VRVLWDEEQREVSSAATAAAAAATTNDDALGQMLSRHASITYGH